MPAIETNGLTKGFGDVVAVDDLSLDVEEGEIFGFLGPNGAGKSTTINMLLGFMTPSDGSATVLGHDVERESRAIRERVGVLPEGAELYDRLTGREHVEFAIRTKDARDDPDEILDAVGLDDARDRAVGGYSKGMTQRLALGMALVGDPDLLILDEPSSGLDPTGIQEMRHLVREQADAGTTVFFSSHILPEVEQVCDRVGIMNAGTLVAVDSIDDLRDSASGTAAITVDVDGVPDTAALESTDSVESVAVTDGVVEATLTDPAAKVDVVRYLDERTAVTDIISEETSLEHLFNTYTSGTHEDAASASANGAGEDESPVEEVPA